MWKLTNIWDGPVPVVLATERGPHEKVLQPGEVLYLSKEEASLYKTLEGTKLILEGTLRRDLDRLVKKDRLSAEEVEDKELKKSKEQQKRLLEISQIRHAKAKKKLGLPVSKGSVPNVVKAKVEPVDPPKVKEESEVSKKQKKSKS